MRQITSMSFTFIPPGIVTVGDPRGDRGYFSWDAMIGTEEAKGHIEIQRGGPDLLALVVSAIFEINRRAATGATADAS